MPAGLAVGTARTSLVGGGRWWGGSSRRPARWRGVEVVGVGGDDEVGAGAGFDLEAEDLGAGEIGGRSGTLGLARW